MTYPFIDKTMSNADYHKRPELSKSNLDHILQSPRHYEYHRTAPKKSTPAFTLGSLFHTLVLQPDLLLTEYTIEPEKKLKKDIGDEAWKIYKQKHEDFEREAQNRIVVDKEQVMTATAMRDSVYANDTARKILTNCTMIETSAFWIDEETGLPCRCRPDAAWSSNIIVDLKSSSDASRNEFKRSIAAWNYDLQAYHYLEGFSKATGREYKTFVFIVCEKVPPYSVAIYTLDEQSIATGGRLQKKILNTFAEYKKGSITGDYPDEIQEIGMSAFNHDIDNR